MNQQPSVAQEQLQSERLAKWKTAAREGAKLIGVAAWKLISRTLAWGAAGLFAGVVAFTALFLAGLLETSSPWSTWIRWAVLPVYVVAGAGLLGYAGMWRGIGRTLLYVGVERGIVTAIVDRVLDRTVEFLRGSEKMRSAMDRGDQWLSNLPLQTAENALKGAINETISSNDMEEELTGVRRRMARAVKRALTRRVEKYLLAMVRAEANASGGGGVSMAKVLELAPGKAKDAVADMIQGFMGKQLLLMSALALVAFALPPGVMAFFR